MLEIAKYDPGMGIDPLAFRVGLALGEVEAITNPLVTLVDRRHPGHTWGWRKADHMRQLVAQAPEIGRQEGLDSEKTRLLGVVFRTHDLGRHIEILNPDRDLNRRRHGFESVEVLAGRTQSVIPQKDWASLTSQAQNLLQRGIRRFFLPEEWEIIQFAVSYHAEREVPKPGPADPEYMHSAERICYLLRDHDKEDIFKDNKYFDPPGVFEELQKFYFNRYLQPSEVDLIAKHPQVSHDVRTIITELLQSNHVPKVDNIPSDLLDKISGMLNRGIAESAWSYFGLREFMPVAEITHSWATYALYQLAMVFDVRSSYMRRRIYENPDDYLGPGLDFIELKAGPEQAKAARDILMGYLQEKLAP